MMIIEQEKKVADDTQPQKFTPLIVTQKKIISLKKKPSEGTSDQSQKPKTVALTRKTAAASVEHVAAQSGSQIKTALRTSSSSIGGSSGGVVAKKLRIDDDIDELLEDELLADSPPTTPAPVHDAASAALKNRMNVAATKVGDIPTSMFTNRRIVVRNNADSVPNNENNLSSSTKSSSSTAGKGIFDRLDKKVIGVNEAAKRKIQRIVINNSTD